MNDEATTTDGVQFSEEETAPSEYETAREAKRTYLKAVRKLRDAIAAGELTHAEGMALRNEWAAGGEIPKEYLDGVPVQEDEAEPAVPGPPDYPRPAGHNPVG